MSAWSIRLSYSGSYFMPLIAFVCHALWLTLMVWLHHSITISEYLNDSLDWRVMVVYNSEDMFICRGDFLSFLAYVGCWLKSAISCIQPTIREQVKERYSPSSLNTMWIPKHLSNKGCNKDQDEHWRHIKMWVRPYFYCWQFELFWTNISEILDVWTHPQKRCNV